jgi:hypothetical protein
MALCPDCSSRNPVIPTYSKAVPLVNTNCVSCGSSFSIPGVDSGGGGKAVEILPGDQIAVSDLSDSTTARFLVAYSPHVALNVTLTMIAKAATVVKSNPILLGTVIDEVNLTWVYNKAVLSQDLTNSGGLTPPTLIAADIAHDYTGLSLSVSTSFTITGNDGEGKPNSIDADTKSISFGNYRGWGIGARRDLGATTLAQMQTFIEGLIGGAGTIELTTVRQDQALTAEGGNLEHFFYFFPKGWGFATFLQNGIPGGFKRLGSVSGTIQSVPLNAYEVGEQDILIDNGLASEAFHIYQSTSDNISGAVFAVG